MVELWKCAGQTHSLSLAHIRQNKVIAPETGGGWSLRVADEQIINQSVENGRD